MALNRSHGKDIDTGTRWNRNTSNSSNQRAISDSPAKTSEASECRCLNSTVGPLLPSTLMTDHPYFVALQAHPEFCSRPLNPSPPFLGLIAAACSSQILSEQLALNETSYVAPHPESAKVVPPSEAATERGRARAQTVNGVKVRDVGVKANGDAREGVDEVERRLEEVAVAGEVNGHSGHT